MTYEAAIHKVSLNRERISDYRMYEIIYPQTVWQIWETVIQSDQVNGKFGERTSFPDIAGFPNFMGYEKHLQCHFAPDTFFFSWLKFLANAAAVSVIYSPDLGLGYVRVIGNFHYCSSLCLQSFQHF